MFFFFKDTATTEIYPLSLHDALPICALPHPRGRRGGRREGPRAAPRRAAPREAHRTVLTGRSRRARRRSVDPGAGVGHRVRSEEHTSELQSRQYLVCRLLLEKKKKQR